MRDPKRIDDFCDRLKTVWHRVPDWRFGQLIYNVFGNKDNFYTEDKDMIRRIETYFNN